MPLSISLPKREFYDNTTNRIISAEAKEIVLEHSLLSVAKWEAIWHKPYFTKEPKTEEELLDYLRCMTLTQNVDPIVYKTIDAENYKKILAYIQDSQTATTFHNRDKKHSREVLTNEVIYALMAELQIPYDPCQKWHLNHLLTLIDVCALRQEPAKKMSNAEMLKQRRALNAQRRSKYKTHG